MEETIEFLLDTKLDLYKKTVEQLLKIIEIQERELQKLRWSETECLKN